MNGETQLMPSPEAFPIGLPIMGESFWQDTGLLARDDVRESR